MSTESQRTALCALDSERDIVRAQSLDELGAVVLRIAALVLLAGGRHRGQGVIASVEVDARYPLLLDHGQELAEADLPRRLVRADLRDRREHDYDECDENKALSEHHAGPPARRLADCSARRAASVVDQKTSSREDARVGRTAGTPRSMPRLSGLVAARPCARIPNWRSWRLHVDRLGEPREGSRSVHVSA